MTIKIEAKFDALAFPIQRLNNIFGLPSNLRSIIPFHLDYGWGNNESLQI
jgi:hypothetical protein